MEQKKIQLTKKDIEKILNKLLSKTIEEINDSSELKKEFKKLKEFYNNDMKFGEVKMGDQEILNLFKSLYPKKSYEKDNNVKGKEKLKKETNRQKKKNEKNKRQEKKSILTNPFKRIIQLAKKQREQRELDTKELEKKNFIQKLKGEIENSKGLSFSGTRGLEKLQTLIGLNKEDLKKLNLKNLKKLYFFNHIFDKANITNIQKFVNNLPNGLEELELSMIEENDFVKVLEVIHSKNLKKLTCKELCLTDKELCLTDKGEAFRGFLNKFSGSLEELKFHGLYQTRQKKTLDLSSLKKLKTLDLIYCNKKELKNGALDLILPNDLSKLQKLKISNSDALHLSEEKKEKLKTLTNLEELVVDSCGFIDQESLDNILSNHSNLKKLTIKNSELNVKLDVYKKLEELSVCHSNKFEVYLNNNYKFLDDCLINNNLKSIFPKLETLNIANFSFGFNAQENIKENSKEKNCSFENLKSIKIENSLRCPRKLKDFIVNNFQKLKGIENTKLIRSQAIRFIKDIKEKIFQKYGKTQENEERVNDLVKGIKIRSKQNERFRSQY